MAGAGFLTYFVFFILVKVNHMGNLVQLVILSLFLYLAPCHAVGVPSGITVDNIKSTEFTVSWPTQADVNFKMTVDIAGTVVSTEIAAVDVVSPHKVINTTVGAAAIVGNTEYTITVYAVNSTDATDFKSATNQTTTVFSAPVLTSVTTNSMIAVDLSWTYDNGGGANAVSEYSIKWDGGSSTISQLTGSTVTTARISSLLANTEYTFTITAVSTTPAVTGDTSAPASATTVFGAPTSVSTTSATASSIGLTWTAPAADGGKISVSGYLISWTGGAGGTQDSTGTSDTVTSLSANTAYSFTVAAKSTAGTGVASDPAVQAITLPSPPGQPTLTRSTTNPTTEIDVSWTAPNGGDQVVDYVVEWTPDSGSPKNAANSPTTIGPLVPGQQYTVTVRAHNSAGNSVPSPAASLRTNPPTPTGVTLSQSTGDQTTSLTLSWIMSTPFVVSSYEISLTPSTSGAAIVNQTFTPSPTSTTTYTVTGLTPGESFTATVQAVSSGVSSSVSTASSPQRTVSGVPGAPNLYQPTDGSDKTTILYANWTAPTGVVDLYQLIVYQGDVGSTVVANLTVSTNFANITSLIPGKRYLATVTAYSVGVAGNVSGNSNYAKTNPPTPTNVQLSQPTVNQTTSLKVDWVMISTPFVISFYEISSTLTTSGATVNKTYTANAGLKKSYTVTGLTPGASYTATVQAFSSAYDPSTQSDVASSINTQRTDPPTPTNVQLSQPTVNQTTSLKVDWVMISTSFVVSSYEISLTPSTSGAAVTENYTANANSPFTYTVTGLTPGESYTATVQAVSSGVSGSVSTASPPQRTDPGVPELPTLSQPTDGSDKTTILYASWTAPTGEVDTYQLLVYQGDVSGGNIAANFTVSTNFANIISLIPGRRYVATVRAFSVGVAGGVSGNSNYGKTNPPTPTNVQLSKPTVNQTTSLVVHWQITSVSFVINYYNISTTAMSTGTITNFYYNLYANSYTMPGLIPGESYAATVQAFSADYPPSTQSDVASSINTQRTDPLSGSPNLYQPTDGSDKTTILYASWAAPTGVVDSYQLIVYQGDVSGGNIVANFNVSTNFANITSLIPGRRYQATVTEYSVGVAGNVSGNSNYGKTNPPTPTNVQLSQPTVNQATSLKVDWVMISTPFLVSSYKISLIPDTSGAAVTNNYTTNAASPLTYIVTGLTPGESYTATVQAVSGTYPPLSQSEAVLSTNTQRTDPPTPTNVQLSQPTVDQTTSLKVDWVMISTSFVVSSYEISLTPATSGAAKVNQTFTPSPISTTTYTVTGLTPGESYTATVQAVSSGVSSSVSTPSPPQRTDPPTPTGVTLSQPTVNQTTSLKVDWVMISTSFVVSSYEISLTPATSGAAIVNQTFTPSPISTTTYTVTGLTPGERYTATVQAVSLGVSGSVSTPSLPQRTVPPTPTGVTLSNPTNDQTSLKMDWVMASPYVVSSYEISLTPATSGTAVTETYSANDASPLTYTVTGLTPGESYTATVQAVSSGVSGSVSTPSLPQRTAVDCPSECEGCIGPCKANSFGGCNCSCIAGYFPAQFICQPVLCKEDTLVHPTLLINVTFPATQAGFKDSSVEKCSYETVNGGKPYGTRNCLLNGTSTTPLWLSSCNTGLENLANVTINSTNERVSVANDLEILTSDPVSITSDDIINSVEVINNVLNTPTVTPEVSSSVVSTVSNLVDVPAEELAVSGEADSLLMTLDTVGEKVELDENGVYEDVTSNVGMAALLPSNKKGRSGLGVKSLSINPALGFRSDQVYLIQGEIPNNVQSFITLPEEAVFGDSGSAKRIIFYAFPNDVIFITK
ncbi:uncharacterized protein LOC144742553 [Ciona intestinalis]